LARNHNIKLGFFVVHAVALGVTEPAEDINALSSRFSFERPGHRRRGLQRADREAIKSRQQFAEPAGSSAGIQNAHTWAKGKWPAQVREIGVLGFLGELADESIVLFNFAFIVRTKKSAAVGFLIFAPGRPIILAG
jgi:hypothetical protein